jgi:peptidoglycan/xylan/chitin deacetylase (PgdA/CDA1 family)
MIAFSQGAMTRKPTTSSRRPRARALLRSAVKSACECKECASKTGVLQRAAVQEHAPAQVSDIVYDVLKSPGQPLDRGTREYMEQRFDHDFSAVRVHTDARAAESARAVNADAYTVGHHIAFGATRYSPLTSVGKKLLAHELAHTVQQPQVASIPQSLSVMTSRDPREDQAREQAIAVVDGRYRGPIGRSAGVSLQKADEEVFKENSGSGSLKSAAKAPEEKSGTTRKFFLTFDDGPDKKSLQTGKNTTSKVLDTLKTSRSGPIKAGFFIQTGPEHGASSVGRELVRRMYREGHIVGVHSGGNKDHEPHIDAANDGRLEGELQSAKEYASRRLEEVNSEKDAPDSVFVEFDGSHSEAPTKLVERQPRASSSPKLVRPPYGVPFIKTMGTKKRKRTFTKSDEEKVSKIYANVGLTNVMWDIDGDGGGNLSLSTLLERLSRELSRLQRSGWKCKDPSMHIVVLYHDIQPGTSDNLLAIIEHIKVTTEKITNGKDRVEFSIPTGL